LWAAATGLLAKRGIQSVILHMSTGKAYLLIKCPNCGFYNIAPIRQKTRLCARCGKTIQIDHLASKRAESFEDARGLLSELNSKVGIEANPKVQSVQIVPEAERQRNDYTRQARKGLVRTFQEEILPRFINREVQLSEILKECEKLGFTREYAEKLLKKLIDGGQAYRPKKDWIRLL
jgi:ribosomal protein S27E